MVVLLPIVICIGIFSLASTLHVWFQCVDINSIPAIVMCIITVIIYGLLGFWSIRKTIKRDKPYYFIAAGIMMISATITLLFSNQIIDLYGKLFI